MGGFFGAVSKRDCVLDVFFGVDYHSHLGTRRGGMAVFDENDGCNGEGDDQARQCNDKQDASCFFRLLIGRHTASPFSHILAT